MASEVDWSVPPQWLDSELEKLVAHADGERGKRVDLLVELQLVNGEKRIVLFHIEIQSAPESGFEERFSRYWAGIYFHTGKEVATLAVLADTNQSWSPEAWSSKIGDFSCRMNFPSCKLLELLEATPPEERTLPHEIAQAQIDALRTAGDPQARYRAKKELLFNLYEKGYTADDLREVYWLIDHMMRLTRDFAKILKRELISYEKEKAMPYITSIERLGIEEGMKKGLKEGMETGAENVLVKLAKKRFGRLGSGTESRIRALSMNDLDALADAILDFESLEQLRAWLEDRG